MYIDVLYLRIVYGIPAIVPNIGGPTELIEDSYNGYCVDVTEVELVALKVCDALERENYEGLWIDLINL